MTVKPQAPPPTPPGGGMLGKPGVTTGRDLDKPKHAGRKMRQVISSPCNRPPATPDHVGMTFHVREAKTHLEFGAKIKWDEVVEDTSGFEIGTVDRYEVRWRALDKQGNPVPQEDQYNLPLVSATNPSGTIYEFKTKRGNSIRIDDMVTITGSVAPGTAPNAYNGTWRVTSHPDAADDGRIFRVQGNTSGLATATTAGRVADTHPQTHVRTRVKQPTERARIKAAYNDQVRNISAVSNPSNGHANPAANTFRYTVPDGFTFQVGDSVTITECKPNLYNVTGVVVFKDATHFEINGGSSGHSDATEGGRVYGSPAGTTTFTFELNKPHNQIVGNLVRVTECKTPWNYNGVWTITKLVDATTLEVDGDDVGIAACQHPGTLADADDSLFVLTGLLPNPKSWAWEGSVRARAGEGCWSSWSEWTDPTLPWYGADPKPPYPTDVVLTFDGLERSRNARITAVLSFTEVGWDPQTGENVGWDVPGGDHEDDMGRYHARLETSQNGLTNWHMARHTSMQASDDPDDRNVTIRFPGVKHNRYYRGKVRSIDHYGRLGDWSDVTLGLIPTDVTPPPPENVVGLGLVDAVGVAWDEPSEGDETTDPNPDRVPNFELGNLEVDHYQVEIATSPAFGTGTIKKRWRRRAADGRVEFESVFYQRRYWCRVRSVNESAYKSAWVTVGPVRPARTKAARTVAPDKTIRPSQIDLVGDYPLAGGLSNQAYLTTIVDPGWAVLEGESPDGVLTGVVVTGSDASHIQGGVAFRFQDGSNFLFFGIGTGGCAFGKVQNGTITLTTSVAMNIDAETTYVLRVELDDTTVKCYVNDVKKIDTTSALFLGASKHGWVTRRGAAFDNGETRFDAINFVPAGADEPSIDDDFDRLATEITEPPPPDPTGDQEFRGLMALTGADGTGGSVTTYGRFSGSLVFTVPVSQ